MTLLRDWLPRAALFWTDSLWTLAWIAGSSVSKFLKLPSTENTGIVQGRDVLASQGRVRAYTEESGAQGTDSSERTVIGRVPWV